VIGPSLEVAHIYSEGAPDEPSVDDLLGALSVNKHKLRTVHVRDADVAVALIRGLTDVLERLVLSDWASVDAVLAVIEEEDSHVAVLTIDSECIADTDAEELTEVRDLLWKHCIALDVYCKHYADGEHLEMVKWTHDWLEKKCPEFIEVMEYWGDPWCPRRWAAQDTQAQTRGTRHR
jgi:hypothetical protein